MEKEQNPISINKKHNVRYWEGLDNLTEDYVRDLAGASIPEKKFKEETIMTLAKDVLSFAVKQLELNLKNVNFRMLMKIINKRSNLNESNRNL